MTRFGVIGAMLVTALLLAASQLGLADEVVVIDGDTISLAGQRIRLAGIDAPERAQTCSGKDGRTYECGRDATAALVALVRGRPLSCEAKDRDRYGRTVAICRTDAGDIGAAMVRQGWAVDYHRYDRECRYCADELDAKANHRGVWSGRFDMPEDWRRKHARGK